MYENDKFIIDTSLMLIIDKSLKDELVRLRLEMAKLSIRTDKVLEKIQRKMLEQSKGGVVK